MLIGWTCHVTEDQIGDRDARWRIFDRVECLRRGDRCIVLVRDGQEDGANRGQWIREDSGHSVVYDGVGEVVAAAEIRQWLVRDLATDESNATTLVGQCIDRLDLDRLIRFIGWSRGRDGNDCGFSHFEDLIFEDGVVQISRNRCIVHRSNSDDRSGIVERIQDPIVHFVNKRIGSEEVGHRSVVEGSILAERE